MNLKNVRSIGMGMVLLLVASFVLGCIGGDSGTASAGPVEATWITADVNGDVVSIPAAVVNDNTNVHFKVNTNTELGEIAVMAFVLGDEIVIRSNVCPPCGSIGFTFSTSLIFKPIFFNPGQPKHLYGSTAPPHGLKTTKLRLYSKN